MKNSILSLLLILSFSIFAQRSSNNIEFNGNSYSNWKSSAQILSGLQSHNDYNVRLSENQIGIQSKVLVNIKATDFLIVFNLIQSGETAAQTDELINVRINNFLNALESLEIPKENIYVDMISMIPIFESDLAKKLFSNTKNEVPTAFEMQKNIHIKFKDIRLVDKMVSLAAQSEIYDIAKLDYFIHDFEAASDTLQDIAFKAIQKKLARFQKLNLDLTEIEPSIKDKLATIYPKTQYTQYSPYTTISYKSSGSRKVRKLQATTYDQVPYSEYDYVLDPVLLEPVVQMSYTITAIYDTNKKLEKPEKPKDRLFYLTPDGTMKPIQLNL